MPCGEPRGGIPPDCAPEKSIIVGVIIVARKNEAAQARRLAVEDQEPVLAMGADGTGLEGCRAQIGCGDERSRIIARRGRSILSAGNRVDAKRVLAPALAAVEAARLLPLIEDEIGVWRIAERDPGEDATRLIR